jgi:hypothetical protein
MQVGSLPNGTAIQIVGNMDRWYRVRAGGLTGFLPQGIVAVDQYESGPFDERYIQVKSLSDFDAAEAYARSSPIPLAVHLSNNSMFAIALAETFSPKAAVGELAELKAEGRIPADAIVAYGNTYVRKLCCR